MPTALETRTALERADKLVTLSPSRGQRTYTNRAMVEEGTLCRVEEKGRTIFADAGRGLGGGDDEPTPSMLLRSAFSSCIAIGVKLWAARKQVPVERVEVEVETDTDARGILGLDPSVTAGFTAIRVRMEIISSADPALVEEIAETSLRFSPLMAALGSAQQIETVTQVRSVAGTEEIGA